VAAAGSEIVAQDHSLVGSIGVMGGKIVAENLADRLGVNFALLARGKHAGWSSPARNWSPDERSRFEASLRETYDRFLSRIAAGRGRTRSQIEPLAEGRLMTARRAREGGLVDHEGGLDTAIALARKRAKLAESAPIEVWPEPPGFLQALSQLTSGQAESSLRSTLLAPVLDALPRAGVVQTLLSSDGLRAAAVLPYVLSLR
jgi:protease-4